MTDGKPNFLRPTNWKSVRFNRFWEGLRRRKLLAQECYDCRAVIFPPRPLCPSCLTGDLGWVEIDGRGTLHSWTEVHIASPEFDTPFLLGLVDLSKGIGRIAAKIVGAERSQLRIGMPVKVGYVDVEEDFTLYCIVVEPRKH